MHTLSVFSTSASKELRLVADAFDLPPRQLAKLASAGLDHGFEIEQAWSARFLLDVDAALAECSERWPQLPI